MKPGISVRSLEVGARFYACLDYRKVKTCFEILERCKFNSGHGTSTRMCKNLINGEIESKSCNLRVIVVDSHIIATQQ